MSMEEKLKSLSDNQLLDIVKNYKKYQYTEEVKTQALSILLSERGSDEDYLRNNGFLNNDVRESAQSYFKRYKKKNIIALSLFISVPLLMIISSITDLTVLAILAWIAFFAFVYEVVSSFFLLQKCYGLMPDKECPISSAFYFLMSVLLYFVIFFYYNKEIEKDLNDIS